MRRYTRAGLIEMSKEVRATGANQIGQAVKLHATLTALIVEAQRAGCLESSVFGC
jgi:hypothetical protein